MFIHRTAATPNFISEIFYLCNAMGHYGYLRTTQTYDDFAKHHDELQRHHDMINGDGSWIGVSRTYSSVSLFRDALFRVPPMHGRKQP